MPIQLPERSFLPFHPPSADTLAAPEAHSSKSRALKQLDLPAQGTLRYTAEHGSLSHRRNIVVETSHTSPSEELLEGYTEFSQNITSSEASQATAIPLSFSLPQETSYREPCPQPQSTTAEGLMMPKKRRSLQAILVPPFFQSAMSAEGIVSPPPPSPSMRLRSHSAAASTTSYVLPPAIPIPEMPETRPRAMTLHNSPPSDLLDDDPFANLAPAPAATLYAEPSLARPPSSPLRPKVDIGSAFPSAPHPFPTPRSPLASSVFDAFDERQLWPVPPQTPPSTPVHGYKPSTHLRRPRSSGNGQARSAYARPAFTSRPSLPSLNTLAEMHVIVPKVKRGHVGAKLPAEPWELTLPSMTESPVGYSGFSVNDSRRSSGLSTIRDSRLYEQEHEEEPSDEYFPDDDSPDGEEIARSTTPRASEVNMHFGSRPTPLLRAQSDPTPSRSTSSLSSDEHGGADDSVSSPDSSFPSTPQLPVAIPGRMSPTEQGSSYLSGRFSRQPVNSIYDDIAATLDYDYARVVSQLHRQRSTVGISAVATSTLQEQDSECDFEPGTSARTIRGHLHSTHQRTSSSQSISVEWTTEMDVNPLSPISTSSFVSTETTSSGTSSEYGEDVDFLSFHSDSEEGESSWYNSALPSDASPPSRSPSQRRVRVLEDDDTELSETSGADITARLDQLDRSGTGSSQYVSATEELVDSDGARHGGYSSSGHAASEYRHQYNTRANGHSGSRGGGGGSSGHGEGSGGGRRGRDDDDWNRRPVPRTSAPLHNDSDSSDDDSSDDYGEEEEAVPPPRSAKVPSSRSGTDDDVPLARNVPTALRAQRTIRRQIRDERDERRRARSLARPGTSDKSTPVSPIHHSKALPPLDRSIPVPSLPSPKALAVTSITASIGATSPSQHDSTRQSASAPVGRQRTKTMPSQPTSPFSVGELTKKLLRVQTGSQAPNNLAVPPTPSASSRRPSQEVPALPTARSPMHIKDMAADATARMPVSRVPQDATSTSQRLMHMRSFHRPRTAADKPTPPLPMSGTGLHRSATSASKKHREMPSASAPVPAARDEGRTSLDRARSTRSHSRRPSVDPTSRTSAESPRPPMPTVLSGEALLTVTMYQQRIFVGSLQRYCQVELTSSSTAHDALETLQNQGFLDGSASGWMIFEICQDFGMERPIRSFESLSGVTNSWIADKTANVLMAKRTSLAPKLSRAVIPSSSPVLGGYVQWEYKRGKWQKRWLELREHSMWISKRDSGKDQTMVCSLNNFDAYAVTRISKAPKAFVFAVKSTDSLSFFESTTDYVHVFSCDEKDGLRWLENILLARSYVLYQERNILSSTAVTAPAMSGGAALSRAGTRKRPAQPLVNFGQGSAPEVPTAPPPPAFEPGSLLAKRGA